MTRSPIEAAGQMRRHPLRILFVEGNPDGTVGGSFLVMHDLIVRLDRSQFSPIAVFRFENYVAERLRSAGVQVHIFPPRRAFRYKSERMNYVLAPFKKLINFAGGFLVPSIRYARFLRRQHVDLVNLNNSVTRNHPWMVAALLTRTICMTHEMGINQRYSLLARALGRRMSAIVCVSAAVRDAVLAGGVRAPEVTVIHCGIDLSRYRLEQSPDELRHLYSIGPTDPVIGVVGNVKAWKGQETIVRATALLRTRFPAIRCLIVGDTGADPNYVQRLRHLCRQLEVEPNIIFTGFQKNAIDYMRLMDVVVHTSTNPEPFGIVLLEAMSLAKPLIATAKGGPSEVVIDGITGRLVEPGRPELLAAAIDPMLSHPADAAEMGRRGLARLESAFTLEKNLAATVQVYDRVLARTRSRM